MATVLILDEHSANRELLTRLHRRPEARRPEGARQSAGAGTLISLDLRLRGERDPRDLLQRFCHAARDLVGAQIAVAGIPGEERCGFQHLVTSGIDAEVVGSIHALDQLAETLSMELTGGRSLRITGAERLLAAGLSPPFPRARALLAVSLTPRGAAEGWLCLINRSKGGGFREEDEHLANALATVIGRIYSNNCQYRDLLRKADEVEGDLAVRCSLEAAAENSLPPPTNGIPDRSEAGRTTDGFAASDRKRAQSLYRLQDRAIKAVTQGIVITDPTLPENPIVYVSPGFEGTTGYRTEEILGRSMRFLNGKETDPAAIALIQERFEAQEPVTVELLNYRKDQTPFWNQLSISPVRDDAGRLTNFVALHTDVTERRRLENELRQSQKIESVGQLAGGVAHDFNNLLTVINVNAELALEKLPPGSSLHGMVSEIKRAGELSAELTRRLLTLSRRQVSAPRIFSLNRVVGDTERFLRRLIGEDVELSIELAEDLAAVRADPGLIEQALLNLALNARDSMPTGGQLRIVTRNVVLGQADARPHLEIAPGLYVVLSVSDSGCGMSAEIKSRLFEPFFTTKKPGQGTGLGLSTVYGIVKQSGGHIEVESESGVGSKFEIYLPAVVQAEPSHADDRADRSVPRGNETVLVVEDDARVRGLISRMLTAYGYKVLESENGVQAIDLAGDESRPIDLIVTDVVLPGMGGRIVAKRVVERQPRAKVLFVSGYADDAIVRHGVLQEQVHFLQKPFTSLELAEKIREALDAAY